MKKRLLYIFILMLVLFVALPSLCYAVTEADVQGAVDSSSKEAVSGNLFVWFLCAIAFMKVSQKIDSFMSSLGISVGRTGGSMMGEAMIVGKAIGSAFKSGGKFAGFGKGGSAVNTGGTAPAGKSGFFGGLERKMAGAARGTITGNGSTSGGMMASIGKKMYENSINKGGAFASSVIGSVARGEINTMGTISGANGQAAMESYFGYNSKTGIDKKEGKSSKMSVEQGGSSTITSNKNTNTNANSNVSGNIGFNASGQPLGSEYSAPGSEQYFGGEYSAPSGESSVDSNPIDGTSFSSGYADSIPTFTDIEMGGGRITGMETSSSYPDGIQFAMYDAEKYAKPEGKFEMVTAVDNSKWYKQYAAPAVERTPYMDPKGKVQYNEKIIQKMPKAPMRKDRM